MKSGAWTYGMILGCGSLWANSAGLENDINDAYTMASGGAVSARAANAATAWYNPAGLSNLNADQLNLTLSREEVEYKVQPSSGGPKAEAADQFLIPAMYYANKGGGRWSWGLGLHSPYGLSFDWIDPTLKYVVTKSEFQSLFLSPAVSWQASESLSVAAGINVMRSEGELRRQLNLTVLNTVLNGGILSPTADATTRLEGEDLGLGAQLGLQWKVTPRDTMGAVWRSGGKVELDGELTIEGLGGTSALVFGGADYVTSSVLELELPPSLTLGYARKVCERLTLELDLEWTQWSAVDAFRVSYGETNPLRLQVLNTDNPSRKDWDDTLTVALGGEYALSKRHALLAGTRYRPSPVPDGTADPLVPVSDLWNLDLGFSWIRARYRLDFVVAHAWSSTRKIDNNVGASSLSTVDGKYTLYAQVIGLSLNWML